MKLEPDTIYQHDEYEEVLVLGIHQRYESYDTQQNTGIENGVSVQYTDEWDGYGAMFGTTVVDPIEEFTTDVGEKLRRFHRD